MTRLRQQMIDDMTLHGLEAANSRGQALPSRLAGGQSGRLGASSGIDLRESLREIVS